MPFRYLRNNVYLDTPYVSVHWEGPGPWVFVEWKAWANSTEYRAAHEAILGAIRDHRAARLLIDARHAKVISEEDQRWLDADWIPRAVTAGRRWTAVVMPSSALVRSTSGRLTAGLRRGISRLLMRREPGCRRYVSGARLV